jgi:fructose-specific component phosphotransferase system IIB-like protein
MILVTVLSLTIFGQAARKVKTETIDKKNDVSSVLGKPVYESTVDSLNTKVWIISQKKNKALMQTKMGQLMGKMDNKMNMDKETKEAVLTGTHYFIFDVTNITSGKQFADTSAKVEIVSPSKIVSSVNLQPMMNHFGGGVSLDEKGEYLFTINLNVGASYRTSQFKYEVK